MTRFYFAAQDKSGNVTQGDLEARDRDEAIQSLTKRDLSPLRVEELAPGEKKPGVFSGPIFLGGNSLGALDEINIVRHLGTILVTGTDLISGLEMIGEDAINPFVKKMLFDIRARITRGEKFSDALKAWSGQFNPIFISLVRAGEASGNLPSVLLSYAVELRKDYNFSRRLKGAMIYPIILVVALLAMLTLVLTVVTPRLKELFASTQSQPPFYTKIFFAASDFLLAHMLALGIVLGIVVIALIGVFRIKRYRRMLSGLLWYLPFLNQIQKNLVLMRFAKTLSSLLTAGFSLKAGLLTVSDIAPPNYRDAMVTIANEKLERGVGFSASLTEYPQFFPRILVSVVKTGERSGQLAQVLTQMGEFYEEEVIYALELFLTLIEPVLLLIVGLIVGLIASSLIAPIYRLIGSIH